VTVTLLPLDLSGVPRVDAVGVEERVAALGKRSIKKSAKLAGIRLAISMIDLTTLEGKDSEGKVLQLCRKALQPLPGDPTVGPVAAVCVYPNFVAAAKRALAGSGVKVASVATGFPAGQVPLAVKLDETRRAVEAGADEIDMVIDRGAFLAGELGKVYDEIAQVKARSSSRPASSRPTTTCGAPPGSPCRRAATSSRPRPARSSRRRPPASCW